MATLTPSTKPYSLLKTSTTSKSTSSSAVATFRFFSFLLLLKPLIASKISFFVVVGIIYQAVRNERDLESLNVPRKYRSMNSFWKYYSGEEVAPFPTIFIGGNHEASNYLWELSVTFLIYSLLLYFNFNLLLIRACTSVTLSALFYDYEENQGSNSPPLCCHYQIIKNKNQFTTCKES